MDVSYRTLVRTQSAYFMTSFFSFLVSFSLFFFFATFLCVCVSSLSAIRRNGSGDAKMPHTGIARWLFVFFFSFPRRLARWCRYLLYLVWPSEKKHHHWHRGVGFITASVWIIFFYRYIMQMLGGGFFFFWFLSLKRFWFVGCCSSFHLQTIVIAYAFIRCTLFPYAEDNGVTTLFTVYMAGVCESTLYIAAIHWEIMINHYDF